MRAVHFILISNYLPDDQESMLRFAAILAKGLREKNVTVEIISPRRILLGENANPNRGVAKWLGYVDKWILFPFALRKHVKRSRREFGENLRYHICDHSNAPYLAHLPADITGITCHDVLAIKGALGDPTAYCQASRMGVILQKWILKNLRKAERIACVSHLTLRQLCEVTGEKTPKPGWRVLHNAFNANFVRLDQEAAKKILSEKGISVPQPFLLHVGSDLPRKNRAMLIRMITQKESRWRGNVCFAGQPIEESLREEIKSLNLLAKVYSVIRPDHQTLCALYSLAHAFVFPSFSEGFGWPLIEAQACGTPVIASNLEPLPEVSGGAAIHADPHDPIAFAQALEKLSDPSQKQSIVDQGYKNAKRFGLSEMIDGYLKLHGIQMHPETIPAKSA